MKCKIGGHSKKGKQQSNPYIIHKECTLKNHIIKKKKKTHFPKKKKKKRSTYYNGWKGKNNKTNIQRIEHGKNRDHLTYQISFILLLIKSVTFTMPKEN